jgi:hypothetical protein
MGKYFDPSCLTFSTRTVKYTNSKQLSNKCCQIFGIIFAFAQIILINKNVMKQLKNASSVEFVIEKSRIPKLIGNIFKIENCSNGEKNIMKKKQ